MSETPLSGRQAKLLAVIAGGGGSILAEFAFAPQTTGSDSDFAQDVLRQRRSVHGTALAVPLPEPGRCLTRAGAAGR